MYILKYFKKRKVVNAIEFERLNNLNMPFDYMGFILKYDNTHITSLITSEPHAIGFVNDNNLISIYFLPVNELYIYQLHDGEIVYREDIVKIAENNYNPSGGIYMDMSDKYIYYLIDEPVLIEKSDRGLIAKSFYEFLEIIKIYKILDSESGSYVEWDLELMVDIEQLNFDWDD